MFKDEGARVDKHKRSHDVYSVGQAVRVARRVARDAGARQAHQSAARRVHGHRPHAGAGVRRRHAHMVSGYSEAACARRCKSSPPKGTADLAGLQVGSKWLASVGNPKLAVEARVEELGFKRIVTGPTREAVELKVRDLLELGASLVQEPELVDGVWTAVCERV